MNTTGLSRLQPGVYLNKVSPKRGIIEIHKSHPDYIALREKLKNERFLECELGLVRSVPLPKVQTVLDKVVENL